MNILLAENIARLRKLKKLTQEELAQKLNIFFQAVSNDFPPECRAEIIGNYQKSTSPGGLNAFNAFVHKPFIPPAPEKEPDAFHWKSGELFQYYTDWLIRSCDETVFDCNSSGVAHRHCMDTLIAERAVE